MMYSYEEFVEGFEDAKVYIKGKTLTLRTRTLRGISFNGFTKVSLYVNIDGVMYKVKDFMVDPYGRYDNRGIENKDDLNKEIRYLARCINKVLKENTNLVDGEDREGYIYASLESSVNKG